MINILKYYPLRFIICQGFDSIVWDVVYFTKLFKMRARKKVINGKEIDVAVWTTRCEEIGNDVYM